MSSLTNSTRKLYKATLSSPKNNPLPKGYDHYTKVYRSLEKINFIYQLAIEPDEIEMIRSVLKERKGRSKADTLKALDTVDDIVNDPSPTQTLKYGLKFKDISKETLVDLGYSLTKVRKKNSNSPKVAEVVFGVVKNYLASVKLSDLNKSVKAKSSAMVSKNPSGTIRSESIMLEKLDATKLGDLKKSVSKDILRNAISWAIVNDKSAIKKLRRELPYDILARLNVPLEEQLIDLVWNSEPKENSTRMAIAGFEEGMKIQPVGRLHLERLEMKPAGIEKGELVFSIPLAPAESVTITHKEWSVRNEEFENITQDFLEEYSEKGVAEKNDISMSSESQSKHSTAFGVDAQGSGFGVTISTSYKDESGENQAVKDSRNHSMTVTSKASARTTKEHKFSVKVSTITDVEDTNIKIIRNPSDSSAMRIDYFQLIRKWQVDLIRYGLRMTYDIVIPNPGDYLAQRILDLYDIDRQIEEGFKFSLKLEDLDLKDQNKLREYAQLYGADIGEIPDLTKRNGPNIPPINISNLTKTIDRVYWGSFDLVVENDYEIDSILTNVIVSTDSSGTQYVLDIIHYPGVGLQLKRSDTDPDPLRGNRADGVSWELGKHGGNVQNLRFEELKGRSGTITVTYQTVRITHISFIVTWTLKLKDSAYQRWRFKTWNILRQAAEEKYIKERDMLREKRSRLEEEIARDDALTLRKMEREEIIRGVLGWILGPQFRLRCSQFSSSPVDRPKLADEVSRFLGLLDHDSGKDDWGTVLAFGEFIKYIQQAVEWENMVFILYPYFWDKCGNWKNKIHLYHPDTRHRDFLRAGAARVVLTIRPGFEESFATLMDELNFGKISRDSHPYITTAQEIENYAKTNFPGIPPANPDNNIRTLLYPEQDKAWEEIQKIITLLERHLKDKERFPSTVEGLAALKRYVPYGSPSGVKIDDVPLKDPWNRDYVYTSPGVHGEYDLATYGADGKLGGDEMDADITSWAEGSLVGRWYEYTPTSALDLSLNTRLAQMDKPP
jgi:type II secretion system protein G